MSGFKDLLEPRDCLTPFRDAGVLDDLDVQLARRLARLYGIAPGALARSDGAPWTREQREVLGAAMASRAPMQGHICFDVASAEDTPVDRPEDHPIGSAAPLAWPDTEGWLAALRTGRLVRRPADADIRPLVLDDAGRLYLDRYWLYEERLAGNVRQRLGSAREGIDPALLQQDLETLLCPRKPEHREGVLGQRFAALVAMLNRFSILSGGPGTGKTTTVTMLLLLLLRQRQAAGADAVRVQLLAPTGKAAARMTEAIRDEVRRPGGLHDRMERGELGPEWGPLLARLLDLEAGTIHRALGARPDQPTRFRYHRENPLPVDLVVVDEASMVDFALMTRLVEAVPTEARLVLLGDRDQLASVEAGAVLADLCVRPGARRVVSAGMAKDVLELLGPEVPVDVATDDLPLRDAVANLDFSFRFDTPGIVALAGAIRAHEVRGAFRVLGCLDPGVPGTDPDSVTWAPLGADAALADRGPGARAVRDAILQGWREPGRDAEGLQTGSLVSAVRAIREARTQGERANAAIDALRALDRVRVLCTHRKGPRGVETLNRQVRDWLRNDLPGAGDWYEGRPILVLQNDYHVRLFNGDVGVVLRDPGRGPADPDPDRLVAVFPDSREPGYRVVPQGRLPPHETVFAMTIHKSQGSQFDQVVVLLPGRDSDFVTRELVYTGITRAKHRVVLAGDARVLRASLNRRVQRASGLRMRLWGEESAVRAREPDDLPADWDARRLPEG